MTSYTTPEALAEAKLAIDSMTHMELTRMWRFATIGDPLLQGEVGDYFRDRLFTHFGGFTPAISKALGWGDR